MLGLDPATADAISQIYGGEFLAVLAETPIDMISTKLGAKLIKGLIGIVGTLASLKLLRGRTRDDAYEIFSHFLAKAVDPHIDDIPQLLNDLMNLKKAVSFGSWDWIRRSIIYSPEEITAKINSIIAQLTGKTFVSPAQAEAKPAPKAVPTEIVAIQ